MSHNANIEQQTMEKIIGDIIAIVPATAIYMFSSSFPEDENSINLYVITDKNNSNKMDYDIASDVGVALMWLGKPLKIFCLSNEEFNKRARRTWGLERMVIDNGSKIYGNDIC